MNVIFKHGDITEIPEEERLAYMGYAKLEVHKHSVPFERIRRITGYLTNTLDRWNSSKQAEEKDRVKHGMK